MFVLDTNTLISFFRGEGHVARRLLATPPASIGIPTPVIYELETGLAKSSDPKRRRRQFDALLDTVTVLPFDAVAARAAANTRAALEAQGTPIGPIDTLIAGTAVSCGGVLVTRNIREFSRVNGLRVEDWFSDGP